MRELASSTLAGLMKGAGSKLAEVFRKESLEAAVSLQAATKLKTRFIIIIIIIINNNK